MSFNARPILGTAFFCLLAIGNLLLISPSAAVQLNPGDILVVTRGDSFFKGLVRVNPISGAQDLITQDGDLVGGRDLVVTPGGEIYVLSSRTSGDGPPGIVRVDAATGAQTVIASGGLFVRPFGLALDLDGKLIVVDLGTSTGPGLVISIDPATGSQSLILSSNELLDPVSVVVAPNGDIYIADFSSPEPGGVRKIAQGTNSLSTVVSARGLRAIAVDAAGTVYVAGPSSIMRVQPGSLVTVSENGHLFQIQGLDTEAIGTLVAGDEVLQKIVRVDPVTGGQTVVSSGGLLASPLGIAVWTLDTVPVMPSTLGQLKARYR